MTERFLDAAELESQGDAADVVIIGSGAAGATAARVLSERGLDVIVLEEGGHVPTAERRSDMYSAFKASWRDMGFQAARGRAFTPVLQGSCVGGTTVINGAIIHRLPEAIHHVWQTQYGLGAALPYRRLAEIFDQLDAELQVGTAPAEVFGENNRLLQLGVERLGMRGNAIRRNVADCDGSAHCNQGCPRARKQSMEVSFLPAAVSQGARVYARAKATRILSRGGHASGVRIHVHGDPKRRYDVVARRAVILAASAIQSPLLLSDSGVGRRSRLVGRRLQAHPGTGVVGVFDDPVDISSGATQGYESTHYWDERMKFEAVSMPLEFAAARLPSIGSALKRELSLFKHLAIWGVQVRAEAHGRVGRGLFGGKRIDYDLGDRDVETLKLGVLRLIELMFAAGAREVMPGVHGLPARISSLDDAAGLLGLSADPRRFHCIAAHLFGTAVMGPDPSSSVVGVDFQAHDLASLFVIDSSVFPTNLGVNPQHSICAVAWLASEQLADRLR